MRELLYIPSGSICKFWAEENTNFSTLSLEEFQNTKTYINWEITFDKHLDRLIIEINDKTLYDWINLYNMDLPTIREDFEIVEI